MVKKENIGLIMDSTCGYTEKEAEKMGFYFVPVVLTIDGKEYEDGVDITEDELINIINPKTKIQTSSPSIGKFQEVFDKALKKHDKLFYFGYTSKMSNTWNAGIQAMKEKKYKGKIFAPETKYMSAWIYIEVNKILEMIKSGTTIKELTEVIEIQNEEIVGALAMKTLTYLKNGGRVSGAKAFIGSALKISPIAIYKDGFIDPKKASKSRTFKKSMDKSILMLNEYWEKIEDKNQYEIIMLISSKNSEEEIKNYLEKTRKIFKLNKNYNFLLSKVGSGIIAHIGPEFMGLGIYKK